MLGHNYQNPIILIGSKSGTTRTSVTLESTYQAEATTKATKTFGTGQMSKVEFHILYTMGSGESSNSIEIKLESSPDRTNFYRLVNEAVSTGTSTLTAREFTFVGSDAAAVAITLPIDIQAKYMKIWVKESGVASTKGTLYVEATLSGAK